MRLSKYSGPIIEMSGDFDDVIYTDIVPVFRKPKHLLLRGLVVLDEHQRAVDATSEIVEFSFISCGKVYDGEIGFWVPTEEHLFDNLKSMMQRVKQLSYLYNECEDQKEQIKNLNNRIVQYEKELKIMTKDIKELSGEALQDWLVGHDFFNIQFINGIDSNENRYTQCLLSCRNPPETIKAKKWEIMEFVEFSNGDYALQVKKSVKQAVLKRQEAEKKLREEKAEIDRIVRKVAELKAAGIDIEALWQAKGA